MPTVAQLPGAIRVHQYYADHNPPHFHVTQGGDEAVMTIALPLEVIQGSLRPGALQDVTVWARDRRAALALNRVDALAGAHIQRTL